jgi:hypothetical protein
MATKNTNPRLTTAVSPYGLAQFLNSNVEGLNIQPQRLYQYVRSGKLVIDRNELGKMVVSTENGNAFIEWFLDPNRKATKAEATEEVAEAVAS